MAGSASRCGTPCNERFGLKGPRGFTSAAELLLDAHHALCCDVTLMCTLRRLTGDALPRHPQHAQCEQACGSLSSGRVGAQRRMMEIMVQMPDDARRWLLDVWTRQAEGGADGDAAAEAADPSEGSREEGERADGAPAGADAGALAGGHPDDSGELSDSGGSSGDGGVGGAGAGGVAGLPRETAGDDVD